MIDLRMVADDHGYTQLQVRSFCIQRGWTEWKSVPIVHDPSQLVDRIEVFDAKTSGAKSDGGLTAAQVAKIVRAFENARQRHQLECLGSGDVKYVSSQAGMAAGIDDCLSVIRSELSPQPDEPSVDEIKPSPTSVEDWVFAETPEIFLRLVKGEVFKARFKREASNPNWVCTDVDGYDLTLRGWDQGSFIDSAGEQWDLCQVYCKQS